MLTTPQLLPGYLRPGPLTPRRLPGTWRRLGPGHWLPLTWQEEEETTQGLGSEGLCPGPPSGWGLLGGDLVASGAHHSFPCSWGNRQPGAPESNALPGEARAWHVDRWDGRLQGQGSVVGGPGLVLR